MAAPNADEIEKLEKFKDRFKDDNLDEKYMDPVFLLRWIRARDGNLDLAEEMLRKSLKWRLENDIENIMKWVPPLSFTSPAQLCTFEFLGYDPDNSPVIWVPAGLWQIRETVMMGEKENLSRYIIQMFESTLEYMKGKATPLEYPVTQCVYLIDLDQLSLRMLTCMGCVEVLIKAVRDMDANYPELVKNIFFVNAGSVFTTVFAIVKPFLSVKTCGKMEFMGRNSWEWPPILLKTIPGHVLPMRYGGTNRQLMPVARRRSLFS